MSAREFDDWVAFSLEEPFGAWWTNWQTALLAQLMASIHTPRNKRRPRFGDFMYKGPAATRKAKDRAVLQAIERLAANADIVIDNRKNKDGRKN